MESINTSSQIKIQSQIEHFTYFGLLSNISCCCDITSNSNIISYTNNSNITIICNQCNFNRQKEIEEKNKKTMAIKSNGWFPKTKSIIKYLYEGYARCFECYENILYENISHSRIISNYNRNDPVVDNKLGSKLGTVLPSQFEKYYKIVCICSNCFNNKMEYKFAPRTYGDIISYLLINDRLDILAEDLNKINCNRLQILLDKINYSLFNYNEKLTIYNNLVSENTRLKNNLDMEIEKFKILNEHKSKNQELHLEIKKTLLQSTKNLFSQYNKIIDEQVAKYNDLNCAVKYNIPECKVCMMREVRLAMECGHLLCTECNNNILEEQQKKDDLFVDNLDNQTINGFPCPFCKTYSTKTLQIYL